MKATMFLNLSLESLLNCIELWTFLINDLLSVKVHMSFSFPCSGFKQDCFQQRVFQSLNSILQLLNQAGLNPFPISEFCYTFILVFKQVNKIEVQYDKTSKQVDVQALKETLWLHIQETNTESVQVILNLLKIGSLPKYSRKCINA